MKTVLKGETKDEEMKAKEVIDEKQKKTVYAQYEKKIAFVKEARTLSADPAFIRGLKARVKRRDDAYKSLIKFLEIKPYELQIKEDLKEFNKYTKDLKESIEDINEFTRDLKAVVEDLQAFVNHYDDAALFYKEINTNADFNLKTCAVTLAKIKR